MFDPAAIFQAQIKRSADCILKNVQANDPKTPPLKDQELAFSTLQYALDISGDWQCARHLFMALAAKMEQAGAQQQWVQLLEYGLHCSQKQGDQEAEAHLSFYLGSLYRILTRYEESQRLFEQSAEIFSAINYWQQQAHSLCKAAYIAHLRQHTEIAVQFIETSFDLLKQHDVEVHKPDSALPLLPAVGYGNFVLGIVALEQQNPHAAQQYFETSLFTYHELGELRMIAMVQGSLGVAYEALEEYDAALNIYDQAVKIFAELDDIILLSRFRMNMGNIYLWQDQLQEAINIYSLVEPIFRRTDDKLSLANCWLNLGIAYRGIRQCQKSRDALLGAMNLFEQLGRELDKIDAFAELGIAYEMEEKYSDALAIFQEILAYLASQPNTPRTVNLRKEILVHSGNVMDNVDS